MEHAESTHLHVEYSDPTKLHAKPTNLHQLESTKFRTESTREHKLESTNCSSSFSSNSFAFIFNGINVDFFSLLATLNSRFNFAFEMGMFSNGSMLSKFDLFETIVRSLSWIRISIDAGKASTYDKLRVTNQNNNFDAGNLDV